MFSKKKKSYSAAVYESNEPTEVISTMDPHKSWCCYLELTKKTKHQIWICMQQIING